MKLSVVFALGLIGAGALALAPVSFARDAAAPAAAAPKPAAPAAAAPGSLPKAAAKRPAAKAAAAAAVRRGKDDTGSLPETPSFSQQAVGWELIEDAKTGVRLGVPEKLVPHLGASRSGTRWSSTQGQIQIETFRLSEAALPALFDEERKFSHRQVASSNLKADSFFILGSQGLKNFVVRAEAQGTEVRGVTVLYDQATEGTMSNVAIAVANAFVGFPDPKTLPPAGLRRRVDYGSAIVVSRDGVLVTTASVADQCEAITVPPFGHAERIAEDRTTGLALLRLYGARNLVPAALADTRVESGDVTLIGIADPLAQTGDAAVATPARLSASILEPAPKLGFSGAAVVDARGRLAGMVDLRPSVVAGASAGPVVTMVPTESIRALLQAQRIAPAPADGAAVNQTAINQSVLRVICVRK
jgi:Trypsin-like peptidase domain